MILFFDTSALIKKYIQENGSDFVDKYFQQASKVIISPVTYIESMSTIKRILIEKNITIKQYNQIKDDIIFDLEYFTIPSFSEEIEYYSVMFIEKYQLKSLDSIQLSSAHSFKSDIDIFLTADNKLAKAASNEGFSVKNPLIIQ